LVGSLAAAGLVEEVLEDPNRVAAVPALEEGPNGALGRRG
tara:strand:+ start:670 stop:789 length:120 start_codon:yes stop_codon:yes gene_type:complete